MKNGSERECNKIILNGLVSVETNTHTMLREEFTVFEPLIPDIMWTSGHTCQQS